MTDQELAVKNKQEVTREEPTRPGRTYQPEVDIFENPEGLWLWFDMPGVENKDVSVHLEDGVLTIEGRVSIDEYKELQPLYTEYNVGNYQRRFSISNDVDTERIEARITNGVLELRLPKAERAKPRKIAVNVD
jgi:HSP20 family protein